MGLLINGKWHDKWYDTKKDGAFKREDTSFHHLISSDNTPDLSQRFQAESNRYHLYVSLACPWAHRAIIFRRLKQLEEHISMSIVSPDMLEHGWTFNTDKGSSGDDVNHCDYLYEIYVKNDPSYSGRVTVPVLWDKKTNAIVNNESSEIIRIFNEAFNTITGNKDDYYPSALQKPIDEINDFIYNHINNGVYKCGFATKQHVYEKAYNELFEALDHVESILTTERYLTGDKITEADWRLFTTMIRFDAVYYGHFKCNKRLLEDYPALSQYIRELYQWPGVSFTVNFEHIKRHYYFSHKMINPTQIVPVGPEIDYILPHQRT